MKWKERLKKATPEEEAEFKRRMREEVPWLDKLVMVGTAFFVLILPCLLILIGISLLAMWVFRVL